MGVGDFATGEAFEVGDEEEFDVWEFLEYARGQGGDGFLEVLAGVVVGEGCSGVVGDTFADVDEFLLVGVDELFGGEAGGGGVGGHRGGDVSSLP